MNETLFEELAEITIPTQPISKDLLDEAIDLLLDIKDLIKKNRITSTVFSEDIPDYIIEQIDSFLNLVDEKNKVMYE